MFRLIAELRRPIPNPWIVFLMVIMASGIARGRVRRTLMTELRKMAAILQLIG